jgi:hypothetical protein
MDLDSDSWVPQRSTTEVKLGGAFHVGVEVFGMEWSGKPRSSCQGLLEGLLRSALQFTFIELDDGNIYRKALYLMVKTMVSCNFYLKPIQ